LSKQFQHQIEKLKKQKQNWYQQHKYTMTIHGLVQALQ